MSQANQLGKKFAYIFWGLFLLLGYWFFESQLNKQYNPNQDPSSYRAGEQSVLVLKRNRMGHYVTSGQINGYPVTFLLDTGATDVAVPKQVADAIGLPYGAQIRVGTANGQATAYRTEIRNLNIGELKFTEVRASILPGMNGDEILLGMSALKRVEFSQRGDQLTLKHFNQ